MKFLSCLMSFVMFMICGSVTLFYKGEDPVRALAGLGAGISAWALFYFLDKANGY